MQSQHFRLEGYLYVVALQFKLWKLGYLLVRMCRFFEDFGGGLCHVFFKWVREVSFQSSQLHKLKQGLETVFRVQDGVKVVEQPLFVRNNQNLLESLDNFIKTQLVSQIHTCKFGFCLNELMRKNNKISRAQLG